MSEEKKTFELKDEDLEKVNGGLINMSQLCPNCSCFSPINPNEGRTHSNCQQFNKQINICIVAARAGNEIGV